MFNTSVIAVLVASVAGFAIGMLWYSPVLFGKQWMKLMGYTAKRMQSAKVKAEMKYKMPIALVGNVVQAYVLLMLFQMVGIANLQDALMLGFLIWLGFMNFIELGKWLWGGKKLALYYIDTSHALAAILLMSGILVILA